MPQQGPAIWVAAFKLSDTTDRPSQRLHLGQTLGGVILLAGATNLPEIAITVSATLAGQVGIAVGNILGGIAVQTLVLVALDVFGMKERVPRTYKVASLTLVIEGLLAVAMLNVAVSGTQLPGSLSYARIGPFALLIALLWVVGVWLVNRANKGLAWHDSAGDAPDTQERPKGHSQTQKEQAATARDRGTIRVALLFAAAAMVTLVAGVALERAGDAIAGKIGMSGVLFGATVLAAAETSGTG